MAKCMLRNQTLKSIDKFLEHELGLYEYDWVRNCAWIWLSEELCSRTWKDWKHSERGVQSSVSLGRKQKASWYYQQSIRILRASTSDLASPCINLWMQEWPGSHVSEARICGQLDGILSLSHYPTYVPLETTSWSENKRKNVFWLTNFSICLKHFNTKTQESETCFIWSIKKSHHSPQQRYPVLDIFKGPFVKWIS